LPGVGPLPDCANTKAAARRINVKRAINVFITAMMDREVISSKVMSDE
jgi:hypothetical protein